MKMFAVHYTYRADEAAARDEHRPAHRDWLRSLVEEDVVVSAGAFADGSGALILLNATAIPSVEAAHKVLADDPFAHAHLAHDVSVREWSPVMGELSS
ncbi:hypothetical protein IEU95_05745 [Hoyosella rhizosphaerae]|uniref:YCII-related domain-containing protein n=1 Tax=Hoyosella rhizosphaerae TaxID=1755582 RepID=A0A916XBT1_9ACTN|nr:YciI family protein [Hoyosella rhizosphaerae]MBN4926324.1 hypothetical protein [Hoyosella rhizosphaerae]GGC60250.1 hypothetical protein GCM10011410_10900 [Hoyosella rhizosphaerae]